MPKIEFVSVGHSAADTQITSDGKIRTTLGGGGFSPAITASTVLDPQKIGIISNLGNDQFGKQAIEYLTKRGINQDGLIIVPEGETTWVVLMEFSPDSRRIAVAPGVSQNFRLSIPPNYKGAKYIHIGSGPSNQQLEWMNKLKGECPPNTIYSVDPLEIFIPEFPEETKEVFRRADIVFINEREMKLLNQFGGEIAQEKQLVLKLGEQGLIYRHNDTRLEIPAPKVNVVHTTGAGEAIAGVFLGLRTQDIPVEQALVQAVQYASISVTDFGIIHLQETIEIYNRGN